MQKELEQLPLFKILGIHFIPRQEWNINFLRQASMKFPAQIRCSQILGGMTEDIRICPRRQLGGDITGPLLQKRFVVLHLRMTNITQEDEVGCALRQKGNV